MRVYFVGASGTGKTTLARYVSERYGLPLLPSAARSVCAEEGISDPKLLFTDVATADRVQAAIFRRQRDMEWQAGGHFVSDRAFDHMAYNVDLSTVCGRITADPHYGQYMSGLHKRDEVILFWVRPCEFPFVSLKDGFRDPFVEPSFVHRQDGTIQFILESHCLRYFPISGPRLRERIRLVQAVLDLAGLRPV